MIVKDILNILKAEITTPVYANGHVYDSDCLVYSYAPLTSNGVINQSRIEFDCISSDYAKGFELLQTVRKVLLTVGDKQLNDIILNIEQNGGGYIFDDKIKVHIFKAIFSVKEKVRH